MIKEGITDKKEVKELCDIATNIVGLEQGSLISKSRKEPYTLARSVVSNICLHNGLHFETIAKVLNRDRTSIYHYKKRHEHNFKTWSQYRTLFTKVFNTYKENIKEQKTFLNNQDLRTHLFRNGVNTSEGGIYIIVKSALLKTSIKTSYKDFSNQLEKIRIALIDYQYKIEVQF